MTAQLGSPTQADQWVPPALTEKLDRYSYVTDDSSQPASPTQPVLKVLPILGEKLDPYSMATNCESAEEEHIDWKPQRRELLVMATLAVISLMVALDATILVSVLPALSTDLRGTAAQAFWAGSSYLLAHAVVQPFIAALSDIFGRRWFVLGSITFFTVGSVLCAVSQNFTQLLAGRVIQGIGGGGVITMSQVIYADMVPLRQRPKYFAIVLGAWAVGSVIGPLVGGIFVQKASWRWCFWLNLPFCGLGFAMAYFFLRFSTAHSSFKSKLARVDWLGGFLFISSLTSFLIAISWGGVQFAWVNVATLVPLLLGVAGLVGSLLWERYGAREAFLKKSLFSSVSAVASYICALLQGLILYMGLYYATFYFTAVRFRNPIHSGLDIFPATCFILPGSAVISALITRLGKFRWAIWTGWLISTVGAGLVIQWDVSTKTAVWAAAMSIFGLGMGMVLSSVNFAVQAIASATDASSAASAASMYAFMRSVGMSLGVALGGTVMQNLMLRDLQSQGLPTEIARNAEVYVATLRNLAPNDPTRIAVLHSYVAGFRGVFGVMTAISGVGFLISLCIKHYDMNKMLQSKHKLGR